MQSGLIAETSRSLLSAHRMTAGGRSDESWGYVRIWRSRWEVPQAPRPERIARAAIAPRGPRDSDADGPRRRQHDRRGRLHDVGVRARRSRLAVDRAFRVAR